MKISLFFGGKEKGIPHPAKLTEKATSYTITGGDAPIPSIRSESIIFAEFPPDHLLFNDFVSCNRVIGHRYFLIDNTIRDQEVTEM
jgi:hypothetical protein